MKPKKISQTLRALNAALELNDETRANISDHNALKKIKMAESYNNNAGKRIEYAMGKFKIKQAGQNIEDYFD